MSSKATPTRLIFTELGWGSSGRSLIFHSSLCCLEPTDPAIQKPMVVQAKAINRLSQMLPKTFSNTVSSKATKSVGKVPVKMEIIPVTTLTTTTMVATTLSTFR